MLHSKAAQKAVAIQLPNQSAQEQSVKVRGMPGARKPWPPMRACMLRQLQPCQESLVWCACWKNPGGSGACCGGH